MRRALLLAAATALAAAPVTVTAQSLANRIATVRDGVIRMTFASRPDVCTDGNGSTWTRSSSYDWGRACVHGPLHVTLGRADGQTISVRTTIGGRWSATPSETDLGEVASKDAANYLAGLAHSLGGHSGDEALSGAVLAADYDVAPEFTSIVRDDNAPMNTRRQSLFWLGQSDMPTHDLTALYEQLPAFTLREQFTFVLSQRHDDASVVKLIEVAQHDRDTEVRKRAMFWLGQSKDPKAARFLRDLLTR